MPNYVFGKDCKAYFKTTTVASASNAAYDAIVATATLADNLKDLKLNLQSDKVDVTTRGSNGWVIEVAVNKKGNYTFTMLWKPADAFFTALQTAWLAGTELFFTALDGLAATAGSQGLAGNVTVTSFSRNEGLKDVVMVDVELSPSSYTDWYTV